MISTSNPANNNQSWYSKDCEERGLSAEDQKYIWESLPDISTDTNNTNTNTNNNDSVSGSVNGGKKLKENIKKPTSKIQAILDLRKANYLTSPIIISNHLIRIFGVWTEKPDHWLYIAQHYTPKTINSVIYQMNKDEEHGNVTLMNPGAYFTSLIKHKHKRKRFYNLMKLKRMENYKVSHTT